MRTAPAARETFTFAAAIVALVGAIDLGLRSRDEGRQAVDAAIVHRRLCLRLRRILLRLLTMFAIAAVLALVLLIALIGLLVIALMIAPAIVAHIGLRLVLRRDKAR